MIKNNKKIFIFAIIFLIISVFILKLINENKNIKESNIITEDENPLFGELNNLSSWITYWDLNVDDEIMELDNKLGSLSYFAAYFDDNNQLVLPEKLLKYYNDTNLMNFLCNSLGKKLKRSSKNASINLMYPLENRVASYIISIGTDKNSEIIKFDETLTVISELLGTSYRHLLRTLNRLCNKNILKKEEDYYIIIDYKNLEELAADIYS